jgi:S1-C subfamily serine protease
MRIRLALALFWIVAVAGCATIPGRSADVIGLSPAPLLGIATNENLVVIDVDPGSAAETAGVQKGDVLIDLTGVAEGESNGGAEIDKGPISFTDEERVKQLIRTADELLLRLQRGEKTVEIKVQPGPPASRRNLPTITPMWRPNKYF